MLGLVDLRVHKLAGWGRRQDFRTKAGHAGFGLRVSVSPVPGMMKPNRIQQGKDLLI